MLSKIKIKKVCGGEIVVTKTHKLGITVGDCECCRDCISFVDECGKNFYCLIDDTWKYPETKDFGCPWLIYKEEK